MKKLSREEIDSRIASLRSVVSKVSEACLEARQALQGTGIILERANAYWLTYLESAVDQTLEKTIEELERLADSVCPYCKTTGENPDCFNCYPQSRVFRLF